MSINSHRQLERMESAAAVARIARDTLPTAVVVGTSPYDLDELCGSIFHMYGAVSAPRYFYGAPVNAFISVNDVIVHGIPTRRPFREGDIVKIDITPLLDGYVAHTAKTILVEPASKSARQLVDCVEEAFSAVLPIIRAGNRVRDLGKRIESSVTSRGYFIIRGLSGHGVGKAIHEEPSVPNYFDKNITSRLKPGLVLAIEPMISAGSGRIVEEPDGWTIRSADRSLTSHFEYTVVVVDGPPLVLTA